MAIRSITSLSKLISVICAPTGQPRERLSYVKHCQARCMTYGPLDELVEEMKDKPKTVLYARKIVNKLKLDIEDRFIHHLIV